MYCNRKIVGHQFFDISELFRDYFEDFSFFFSMFYLSILCIFYIFAFLCFVVLCFVIDPRVEMVHCPFQEVTG